MNRRSQASVESLRRRIRLGLCASCTLLFLAVGTAWADIPGRVTPAGPGGGTSGANPGTQQQELPNITFPAPYNVFEFVVTCMACHGGSIDQTAGHGANWGGSNMASAMRDPIFRANQVLVNNTLKNLGAGDGAGNVCMRCHSSNGWLSGRFDPKLGGVADGSETIQSILLSTDTEGISCEMCHRVIGNVTHSRNTTAINAQTGLAVPGDQSGDPAFNMLAGIADWPHQGNPYPQGPIAGEPMGDATLQFHDGMGYGGKYSGSFLPYFSDVPLLGPYTGQTWGYNPRWPGVPWINPDGSYSFHFDQLIAPPADDTQYAISIEHPTREGSFVKTSEFCGSCHDLTVPVLNHGMPEQRTYTEWKYSDFGPGGTHQKRCQDCHMPMLKHEYADNARVTLNVDPTLAGWYPYARDRNPNGGTAFHKLVGANRDLPQMMKLLYPEVDLEVVGAPTGHDPTIFPGMLSDRAPMWDRATRNTEVALQEAASIAITQAPTETAPGSGIYTLRVKVTNHTGHRIPSGYPDGRRMWIGVTVQDSSGAAVYESGHYDPATATLSNRAGDATLTRALVPEIDASANAVMIYERGTCMTSLALDSNPPAPNNVCGAITPNVLNKSIAFDNRIPPAGFSYAEYAANGVRFWNYDLETNPGQLTLFEDVGRYPDGRNWDEVTYTFTAPSGAALTARAELNWQTHTREFMEHLKDGINGLPLADRGPRPEAPPSPLVPNYPLAPTYLAETIGLAGMTDLSGAPLADNWGGIAYAAWLESGKGAPFVLGTADTSVVAAPAAPSLTVASPIDPGTGIVDPNVQELAWNSVAGADGYLIWVRYGSDTATPAVTADWDKLAVVAAPATTLTHAALNLGKTFQYKVQAFNAAGSSPDSALVTAKTPDGLLLGPISTKVLSFTDSTVNLSWFDQDFNELGFVVERQTVVPGVPLQPFAIVAYLGSQTPGAATGGNSWTDVASLPACPLDIVNNVPVTAGCVTPEWTALAPNTIYNYQISSYNAFGLSPPDLPVTVTTLAALTNPVLTVGAVLYNQVDLAWNSVAGATSYAVYRDGTLLATLPATTNAYSDGTVVPSMSYTYWVDVAPGPVASNLVSVTTPPAPPLPPDTLTAVPSSPGVIPPYVDVQFIDRSLDETGFLLERSTDGGSTFTGITAFPAQAGSGTVVTYRDANLQPKMNYCYRARAVNGTVVSVYSNVGCAVTPGEIPQPPSNLSAKMSGTKVILKWVDNANNETYFELRRLPAFGAAVTVGANVTTYTDSGLIRKTSYTYDVRACNVDGCSVYSAPLTVLIK